MIKILFLATNPSDTTRLALTEEHRTIEEALQKTQSHNHFVTVLKGAVRVADLQPLLHQHTPTIVHFSGHGSPNHELLFLDNSGKAQPVAVNALSELFTLLKGQIRCVVLNACYSQQQAEAIAKEIDCVIGMPDVITEEAASAFSEAFYRALGNGQDVEKAFKLGRNQIRLENLAGENEPCLFVHKDKIAAIHLFDPSVPPAISPARSKWRSVIMLISTIVILTLSVIAAYGIFGGPVGAQPDNRQTETPTIAPPTATAALLKTTTIVAPAAMPSPTPVVDMTSITVVSPTHTTTPAATWTATLLPSPIDTPTATTVTAPASTPTAPPIATATPKLPALADTTYAPIQLRDASEDNKQATLRWLAVALAPGDHYAVVVEHGGGWNWVITDATTWTSDKWLYDKKKKAASPGILLSAAAGH